MCFFQKVVRKRGFIISVCSVTSSYLHPFEYGILRIRAGVEDLLKKGSLCGHGPTMRTCLQILKVKEALWTFTHVSGIEPTNNRAEQWLRAYVIWRKLSFGTKSKRGQRFVERMMTVISSCAIQKRSALMFIVEAIEAYYGKKPMPSLIVKEERKGFEPLVPVKETEAKREAA
jgi:transposase